MDRMSIRTQVIINKWNKTKTKLGRERLIRNHLRELYFNRERRTFLSEFSNQFDKREERLAILFLLKKLLVQNPIEIDVDFRKDFEVEFNVEQANDISLDGATWVDEEIKFMNEPNGFDKMVSPIHTKSSQKEALSLTDINIQERILTKAQFIERQGIGKSTFDRYIQRGLKVTKVGKKIYVNMDEFNQWVQTQEKQKGVRLDFS